MDIIGLNYVKGESDENLSLYQAKEDSDERVYFVKFLLQMVTSLVVVTLGFLCSHAL